MKILILMSSSIILTFSSLQANDEKSDVKGIKEEKIFENKENDSKDEKALEDDVKKQALIKKFESYAEEQRKKWNVTGMAVAIVKGDEVLFSKGFGQRGLTDTRPVDEDTLFQIGSLTKAFTSTLMALEVDKGWVKWEDKVMSHLPAFRLFDPWATAEFQVNDLLAQRSGLPPHAGDSLSFLGFSQEEIVQRTRFLEPISSFRAKYAYQNIFFVMASQIIEKKLYMTYPQLLQKEIFGPLNMNHSSAKLEDYLTYPNRSEWLVHLKDESIYHLKEDYPEVDWNYILGPAGGINSTLKDMTNWLIFQTNQGMFQGKQIVSLENMRALIRPIIYVGPSIDKSDLYYGLGWVINEYTPYPIVWHNGSTLGAYNVMAFIPQEKIGIVILTNGRNTLLANALAFQFFDLYFNKKDQDWSQKLLLKSKEKEKANQVEEKNSPSSLAQPLSNYTGTYRNSIFGNVIVEEEDNHLNIVFGKRQQRMPLQHWDRDIFTMAWPIYDFDSDRPIRVLFSPNSQGKTERMSITLFSEEGMGTFEKVNTETNSSNEN